MSRRRRSDADVHGVAVVDKPAGWTSHDVVVRARRLLGTTRVGHSGTLDPDATGVLVLGVGRATRLLQFLTGLEKRYVGEVVLGTETSTLDASGEVVATHDMSHVRPSEVAAAASRLTGELLQVPPMVSAVRVGGRRLHELAREGQEVEREPRRVTVHRFEVAPTDDPLVYSAEVRCSAGTYVRSLADDLGHALGGGAHLRALRRTAVGPFTLERATPLDLVSVEGLLPVREGVPHLEAAVVDAGTAADVAHGKVLARERLPVGGDGPWAVVGDDGELLAVYAPHREQLVKPAVVLVAPR